MLTVVNSEPYKDLPPSQIVPALADKGEYIASESSFYRIMREDKQQQHPLCVNVSETPTVVKLV